MCGAEESGVSVTSPQRENAGLTAPQQLDPALFHEMYGRSAHELVTFFYRRTRNAEAAAELLAETFAVAAQRRRHNPNLSLDRPNWLHNIAKLELSRYFRELSVSLDVVTQLQMRVPMLTEAEIERLDTEIDQERHARLGS